MEAPEVWKILTEIIRTEFDDDEIEIDENTTANDIEDWDSLTNVQLIVSIEERFGIRFNTGETVGLKNVGQMVQLIVKRSS